MRIKHSMCRFAALFWILTGPVVVASGDSILIEGDDHPSPSPTSTQIQEISLDTIIPLEANPFHKQDLRPTSGIDPKDYLTTGVGPSDFIQKLRYLRDVPKDEVSKKFSKEILGKAFNYFLCPSFRVDGGMDLCKKVSDKFEVPITPFSWKSVPKMLAVALCYDKIVYAPVMTSMAIASMVGMMDTTENGMAVSMGFNPGDPHFPYDTNVCQPCTESWINFGPREGNYTITIGDTVFTQENFSNIALSCPGIFDRAQYYVDQAVYNQSFNSSEHYQYFNAFTIGNSNIFNFYNVIVEWGVPSLIQTYQCNLDNAVSVTSNILANVFYWGVGFGGAVLSSIWVKEGIRRTLQ